MQRNLKPLNKIPPDFESFWKKTLTRLAGVSLDLKVEEETPCLNGKATKLSLSWLSLGSVRIHGYAIKWNDTNPRPLIIHGHGFGSGTIQKDDWASQGMNVLGVDTRGFGKSTEALPTISKWGYMLTGIQSPETYILTGAVCDFIRAIESGEALFKDTISPLVLNGTSFAGGLALMSEALLQKSAHLILKTPTFGWMEGRHFFVKSGTGDQVNQYLKRRPDETADVMTVLRYFDSINFAEKIKCPTLVGIGLHDPVVPAPTIYAIANHLGQKPEIMEFPVSHTTDPREKEWAKFDEAWIKKIQQK